MVCVAVNGRGMFGLANEVVQFVCMMCVAVNGRDMFGLANEVVQFLLERLPGIENCPLYLSRHQQLSEAKSPPPLSQPQCLPVSVCVILVITILN